MKRRGGGGGAATPPTSGVATADVDDRALSAAAQARAEKKGEGKSSAPVGNSAGSSAAFPACTFYVGLAFVAFCAIYLMIKYS